MSIKDTESEAVDMQTLTLLAVSPIYASVAQGSESIEAFGIKNIKKLNLPQNKERER